MISWYRWTFIEFFGDTTYLARRIKHEFERTRRYGSEFRIVVRIDKLQQLPDLDTMGEALERLFDVFSIRSIDRRRVLPR